MTVNPGFGGQKLIPSCMDKLRALRDRRAARGLDFLIEVDGGIGAENAREAMEAGADALVMGSAFFGAPDPAALVASVLGAAR